MGKKVTRIVEITHLMVLLKFGWKKWTPSCLTSSTKLWWFWELVTHSIYLMLRIYVVSFMLAPCYPIYCNLPAITHHHVSCALPSLTLHHWRRCHESSSDWQGVVELMPKSSSEVGWPTCSVAGINLSARSLNSLSWWTSMTPMARQWSALHTDLRQPAPLSANASLFVVQI
jgi:hypothetical protein